MGRDVRKYRGKRKGRKYKGNGLGEKGEDRRGGNNMKKFKTQKGTIRLFTDISLTVPIDFFFRKKPSSNLFK